MARCMGLELKCFRETYLGSPKSLAVECDYGEDEAPFLDSLFEKADFRRDIQFFATNLR